MNFLLQLLNFVVAWAGSWKIGARFPRTVRLPMIIGYMGVGVICGRYVTGTLDPSTLDGKDPFSVGTIVTNMTLAFIAMSAGCELHLPSLGRLKLRETFVQIGVMGSLLLGVGTVVFAALMLADAPLMPASLRGESMGCKWSVAWMLAVVQLAGSVIEVLAIYHETKGSGPVTQLMISTTMLLDMMVVALFAVSQTIVMSACPVEGVHVSTWGAVVSILGEVVLCVVGGLIVSGILRGILMVPTSCPAGGAFRTTLTLAIGWACYHGLITLNRSLPRWMPDALDSLRIDPLLVCMLGSMFLQHMSTRGGELRQLVHGTAPLVMPPFFTVVGANLNLDSLTSYAATIAVFFIARFVALGVGSFIASSASRHTPVVRRHLWMTLQSQSGVTLALVLQVTGGVVGQHSWAADMAAVVTGCVVINQLVGPTLCRVGVRRAGEAQDCESPDPSKVSGPRGDEAAPEGRPRSETNRGWDAEFEATQRSTSFILPDLQEHWVGAIPEEQVQGPLRL